MDWTPLSGSHARKAVPCLFCDIVAGTVPSHKVYEDASYLAFLSIFPNCDGVTVLIPKAHRPSYAFELSDGELADLVLLAKRVAAKIDRAFPDVGRTGLVFEGFGVDHVHAKLFPMHGTARAGEWQPIRSTERRVFERYEGFISSNDGPPADDAKLVEIARAIRAAED